MFLNILEGGDAPHMRSLPKEQDPTTSRLLRAAEVVFIELYDARDGLDGSTFVGGVPSMQDFADDPLDRPFPNTPR